jgi:group I intron endonuclease
MDNYLIYKHTSPSGKSYIGQTKHYDKRCQQHQISTNCRALASAIKKYDWDKFQHEILMEGLSLDEANRWEEVLIKELNTLAPNGYNLTTGGANSSPSEETRAKLSATRTGKTHSDETRAKMSETRTGKKGHPRSEETRAKMSATKLGHTSSDETKAKISAVRTGKTHSDETRAKMSANQMGKKRGPYKKKVLDESDNY